MQNTFDQSYHELCEAILEIGKEKKTAQTQEQFQNLAISYVLI